MAFWNFKGQSVFIATLVAMTHDDARLSENASASGDGDACVSVARVRMTPLLLIGMAVPPLLSAVFSCVLVRRAWLREGEGAALLRALPWVLISSRVAQGAALHLFPDYFSDHGVAAMVVVAIIGAYYSTFAPFFSFLPCPHPPLPTFRSYIRTCHQPCR